MVKRIAITGPESTGKSELAKRLANHYHTVWVPEYARIYLDQLNRNYHEEDLLAIANGQLALQKKYESQSGGYIFYDTEMLVLKIWSEYKYGKCHPWILQQAERQNFDLYLLCNIDLPWEYDPQREHPDHREELFDLYLQEMESRNLNYHLISGIKDQRLRNAVNFINSAFNPKH
jgi:NadR type nicotinamide-nucleotide adenylyltransferase